jgi:hypothetical protein
MLRVRVFIALAALSMAGRHEAFQSSLRYALRDSVESVAPSMDHLTLTGKMLYGYQGWYAAPGDGSPLQSWEHWSKTANLTPASIPIDLWPDVSEYEDDELYETGLVLAGGPPARVYSAWNYKTVERHVRWMRDYGIDGIFLQRFSGALTPGRKQVFKDQVFQNVRTASEKYRRVFAIMYDVSGWTRTELTEGMKQDWMRLVDVFGMTASTSYQWHRGRPVVAIWGIGFRDNRFRPEDAREIVRWFRDDAPEAYRATVVGGVPWGWRTLDGDADSNPAWTPVYRSLSVVMPWTVGAFAGAEGADRYRQERLVPDLEETRRFGAEYMPTVWPGYSRHNSAPKQSGDLNPFPRMGGQFWWHQLYNAISIGATMIYGAMFDENDEATAIYKVASTPAQAPAGARFVTLDVDGFNLPSDWYLRVAGAGAQMLRGDIPLADAIPFAATASDPARPARSLRR